MRESTTQTLIEALKILATDIQSEDGVANAAIYEAAERLEQLETDNYYLNEAGEHLSALLLSNKPNINDIKIKHLIELAHNFRDTAESIGDIPDGEISRKNFICFASILEYKANQLKKEVGHED